MARKMTGMSPEAVARNQQRAAEEVRVRAERLFLDPYCPTTALKELRDHLWWCAFPEREAARLQLFKAWPAMPAHVFRAGASAVVGRAIQADDLLATRRAALWTEIMGRPVYETEWRHRCMQLMGEHRLMVGW